MRNSCSINHYTNLSRCEYCSKEYCGKCDLDRYMLCLGCSRFYCFDCIILNRYTNHLYRDRIIRQCWVCKKQSANIL